MNRTLAELETKLWDAANTLRSNAGLTAHEYSLPVLGLIFLKFADTKFQTVEKKLQEERKGSRREGQEIEPERFQAEGVIYLDPEARYSELIKLPESANIGKSLNDAMISIEKNNIQLAGVLPRNYTRIENKTLFEILKLFNGIIIDEKDGDVFGKIYEYFLGNFAMTEGQGGGEFFTPTSIVQLIVEVLEPYEGRVFDPACGSGGMFVQTAEFIRREQKKRNITPGSATYYGQEKTEATTKLCKMNLAIHGLEGSIKHGNSFYENAHSNEYGSFDYVMANPPFNVKGVDHERIKDDPRFEQGVPTNDNANYLWVEIFLNALKDNGRAGFVMANSASDARNTEMEVRKKIVEEKMVDIMITVSSNFFYTVTLPVTLWFLDKGKKGTDREDKILFIDARHIFKQVTRAHRTWTETQIKDIADIVKAYRGEEGAGKYEDVKGLCKVATLDEVRAQDYSLNSGRYVGVTDIEIDENYDFTTHLATLQGELAELNIEARELESEIDTNLTDILAQ